MDLQEKSRLILGGGSLRLITREVKLRRMPKSASEWKPGTAAWNLSVQGSPGGLPGFKRRRAGKIPFLARLPGEIEPGNKKENEDLEFSLVHTRPVIASIEQSGTEIRELEQRVDSLDSRRLRFFAINLPSGYTSGCYW